LQSYFLTIKIYYQTYVFLMLLNYIVSTPYAQIIKTGQYTDSKYVTHGKTTC